MLIEFYSPMCSHCQAFAPKYNTVVSRLAGRVPAARMDITTNKIPTTGEKVGFAVTGFPTLYLVKYSPVAMIGGEATEGDGDPQEQSAQAHSLTLFKYEGDHEASAVLEWVGTLI